jgi:ribosomal protein S18 acetylase RimI-like enzyme
MMVTFAARLSTPVDPAPLEVGYTARAVRPDDARELGELYFDAYDPGVASATLDEAIDDIVASFGGEYGELWFEASPLVLHGAEVVAAVMTVRRATWDDVPDCPFIIELFTARSHRRRGIARHLVTSTMTTLRAAGESAVALRVGSANTAARGLYTALGFELIHV